jgi:selenide,water dikinase
MGGKPILALNLVCFPNTLSAEVLEQILKGGSDKVLEAGASTVGGHSVEDEEPKYGLAVTGLIHPEQIWANRGAQVGDVLILTKPLGTGIISTAIKADLLEEEIAMEAVDWMRLLNKYAAEAAQNYEISAVTDVTGFALLGHLAEMVVGSEVDALLNTAEIPVMAGAQDMAEMGIIPGGAYRNKTNVENILVYRNQEIPLWLQDILVDPQTSGGLLMALSQEQWQGLKKDYQEKGVFFAEIGQIQKGSGRIILD